MGRLYLECDGKKIVKKNIEQAVYKTLNQTENLKAELVFVDKDEIKRLNREYRNVDTVTDVLSFPSLDNIKGKVIKKENYPEEADGKYLFIGSIVLCEDKIEEQAKELGHTCSRERTYLIVHGLMHLFGYDHIEEKDKKEMRKMEKLALKLLGIEQ